MNIARNEKMKKKYVASFLSLCMLINSISPVAFASETADFSAVSDVALEEETEEQIDEETNNDLEEYNEENIDIVLDNNTYLEDKENSEILFDTEYDESEENNISQYLADEEKTLNDVYEDNDFIPVENSNIQYKYDKNSKTLEFKLTDPTGSKDMPNYKGTAGTPWYKTLGDEGRDELTCVKIDEGIESIGAYSFLTDGSNCYKNLSRVDLPSSVTTIGDYAFTFYATESLTSKLVNIDLSNVNKIGVNAFQNTGIKEIQLLADQVDIGKGAFAQCDELLSVNAKKINLSGNGAFDNCTNLTTFICTELQAVPNSSFSSTKSLKRFQAPGITSIGKKAFYMSGLEKIALDMNNVTMKSTSFSASSLKNICYSGTTEEWKNKGISLSGVTVHCNMDEQPLKYATCTEAGEKIYTCGICGHEYTDGTVQDPLGHDYAEDYAVDKAATCTEAGSESKHCTRCDEIEAGSEKEIPALGHDYVAEVTAQPTCTKDGVRTLTCSRCKDVKTETIPATGVHQWSDWKKTADATVFAAEQQERNCATCDKKETRTVGEKLAATASVNASSVTLKEKQSTGTVKVAGLANGDSITSWKSTNTKVFTVSGKADGTCKLTGVKKGTAKLEITLASGLKKIVTVKVQAKTVKTSKISGLAKKMTVKKGEKTTLKPVITPATSQQKVTYSSSNKKVATVSSKGVITAKKAGTAKITVKSGSKKVTVTVTVPKTKTTAIKVGEKVSVKKGKTCSLKAKTTPSNSDEKITYKTSNKKIATVSKSGKIKGVKKGTATITIKSGKIVKKVKVTVK